MSWLTDEVLSSYIDGELGPEEAAQVERALKEDPTAAKRLEELRNADSLVRQAFESALLQPEALKARLDAAARPPARPAGRPSPQRIALLAASLLVAAGLGYVAGGWGGGRGELELQDGELLAAAGLAEALETQASSEAGRVRVDFSFQTAQGGICRQFAVGDGLQGIGCRDGGRWRLAALSSQAAAAPAAQSAYRPAAGGGPLDPTIEALGVERMLEPKDERALIRSGWKLSADRPAGTSNRAQAQAQDQDSPR